MLKQLVAEDVYLLSQVVSIELLVRGQVIAKNMDRFIFALLDCDKHRIITRIHSNFDDLTFEDILHHQSFLVKDYIP